MANHLSVFRLKFNAPLHIGNNQEDYASGSAMVNSDAMYAAIFQAWAMLGKAEWIPAHETEDFGFTLSSLFPFSKNASESYNYYLPRPLFTSTIHKKETLETVIRKKIKKAQWVDLQLFSEILSGKQSPISKSNFNGSFWSATEINTEPFITSRVMPRSAVSRFGEEDTKIFYIERYYFAENAGLYFFIDCQDEVIFKRVEAAMRFLGDEGLGTDRNIGHGKFSFDTTEAPVISLASNQNLAISLGLFCPETKEQLEDMLNHEKAGYELVKRGGWLSEPYNTWRKKNIYFFKEGSCFSVPGLNQSWLISGKNADLRPEKVQVNHPVWRCGKTLLLTF